jgi:hypothetical protein
MIHKPSRNLLKAIKVAAETKFRATAAPAGQGRGGVGTTGIWASEYLANPGTNGLL